MRGSAHFASVAALALLAPIGAGADDNSAGRAHARLVGFQEVPALSTPARGSFEASLRDDSIQYELRYSGLEGAVTQAHIHFGQRGVNGGISVFLCSNLGNGPAGTPACPGPSEGTVSGMLSSASVVGPAAQNIAPGELAKLLQAIRAGIAYANVHSVKFPGGEVRGQLRDDD